MKMNKRKARLGRRQADYAQMIEKQSGESKVVERMRTGGYRCPGSTKK